VASNVFGNIKETVYDTLKIIKEYRSPEVQDSIGKINEINSIIKDIRNSLNTPEMRYNIQNFNLMSKAMQNASLSLKNVSAQLEETGLVNELSLTMESVNRTSKSGNMAGEDTTRFNELFSLLKKTLHSVKMLQEEIKITMSLFKTP
jgi:hypothetical protein